MTKRRNLVFFFLALAALITGFTTGRDLWFTISYLLGLLLIVSFLWAWINIRWTNLSRMTRTRRTQVGQSFEERLSAENTSIIPKLWLEVRDLSTMPAHNISRVVSGLAPKKRFAWRTQTLSRMRGRYRLGPLLIRSSDPFGLFPMERKIEATTYVVVYPMTVEIYKFTLPVGLLSGGDALRRRAFHVTTNASGVRDYAPGDSFGRIHWRSTARRNRLIVKEFELDPLSDLWVIADMAALEHVARPGAEQGLSQSDLLPPSERTPQQAFRLPATTEEYTVTITASIAQYFLKQDRAVGVLAYGQSNELIQPDRGERQQTRILETLAVLRAAGNMSLSNILLSESSRFQRGTTLIVVTPTTDEKWAVTIRELISRGLKVVTILVNPAGFGGNSADSLLSLLHANNFTANLINEGDNLSQALSK